MNETSRPDFAKLASTPRSFQDADQRLVGCPPAIAITPETQRSVPPRPARLSPP